MEDMPEDAKMLLMLMGTIRHAALDGSMIAKPYLDAGAIKVVDGDVLFFKTKFLEIMEKQIGEVQ